MEYLLPAALLLAGFIFLLKGADFLVQGSVSLAKRFQISEIVIGLTIVAFGTSTPELVVNVFASLEKHPEVVLGNVLGSNIGNLLLILGVSSLIYPLSVQKNTTWKEIPFAFFAVLLILFFGNDAVFFGEPGKISRIDGVIFLGFFLLFLFYTLRIAKVETAAEEAEQEVLSLFKTILLIVIGFIGLFLGGKWVVDNAVFLAQKLGMSEKLVSLTIVSIGTSLPELAASAMAAYRKKPDLAMGNIVGSNIFNILLILGTSALVNPVEYSTIFNTDVLVNAGATLMLFVFMFTGKKHRLERPEGALFLAGYIGYIIFLIIRN